MLLKRVSLCSYNNWILWKLGEKYCLRLWKMKNTKLSHRQFQCPLRTKYLLPRWSLATLPCLSGEGTPRPHKVKSMGKNNPILFKLTIWQDTIAINVCPGIKCSNTLKGGKIFRSQQDVSMPVSVPGLSILVFWLQNLCRVLKSAGSKAGSPGA